MKGRANYLCLHRLDQLRAQPAVPHDFVSMMAEWAARPRPATAPSSSDLPEDSSLWHDVAATAETCLGSDCPQYQRVLRHAHAAARRRIRHRHRQSPPALRRRRGAPEHLRRGDSRVPLRGPRRGAPTRGRRDAVLRHRGQQLPGRRSRARRRARAEPRARSTIRIPSCARRSGASTITRDVLRRRWRWPGAVARASLGEERLRIGPDWFGDVIDDGLALATALDGLEAAMHAARRARAKAGRAGQRGRRDDRAPRRRAARPAAVPARGRGPGVRVLRRNRGPRRVPARRADRRLGHHPRACCFDRMRATVLTSATLTVEGSFEYVRGRLGVEDADERARAVGVRFQRAGDPLSAAPDAVAEVAGVRRRGGARGAAIC